MEDELIKENKDDNKKKKEKDKRKRCWVLISPNKGIKEIDLFILILEVLSIAPSVLIFLYSQWIYFDGEETRAIALDLYNNLNTGFFANFSNCSNNNDYSFLFDTDKEDINSEEREENEIPLSFGEWQGIVDACINVNDKIHVLDPGKTCSADEKLINRIPPVNFYKYKGLKICALSDDGNSYYDLLQKKDTIIIKFEECPEGKKSCGYVDTLKNIFCVDSNSECPINYVRLSKFPPIEPIGDLKEIRSDQITFYYSKNPYPNSTKIPYIVNSFKIADSQICALPNLYYSEILLNDLEAIKKIILLIVY